MPDHPGEARDRPVDRALAVGVVGQHMPGLADPAGLDVQRPVQRVADDPDQAIGLRLDHGQRPGTEPGDAQHGDVVLRVEADRLGGEALVGDRVDHRRAALARDDVRGGDDQRRAPRPSRCRRSRARTRCRGRARRSPPRRARLRSRAIGWWARLGSTGRRSTGTDRHARARSAGARAGRSRSAAAAPRSAGRPGAASGWPGSRSAVAPERSRRAPAPRPRRATSPPALSSARSGGKRIAERKNEPAIEPSASSTAAPTPRRRGRRAARTASAPRRCSTTGASRAPTTAPATMPVIASRLATSPLRSPTKRAERDDAEQRSSRAGPRSQASPRRGRGS